MGQLRPGRVTGIPVGANWSVVVVFGLLAYLLATSVLPATVKASTRAYWTAAVIVARLSSRRCSAHELGHALVARRFGVQVKRLTVRMLGGVTEFAREPATAPQQLVVSAAGPLASLAVGVVAGRSRVPRPRRTHRICSSPGCCCGWPGRTRC
jgi:Zn-dependent protease